MLSEYIRIDMSDAVRVHDNPNNDVTMRDPDTKPESGERETAKATNLCKDMSVFILSMYLFNAVCI